MKFWWPLRIIFLLVRARLISWPKSSSIGLYKSGAPTQPVGFVLMAFNETENAKAIWSLNVSLEEARRIARNILEICDQQETWGEKSCES